MKNCILQFVKKFYLSGLILVLTACGVSSLVVHINTEHDRNAPFEQFRTYNWYQPNPATSSQTGINVNPKLHENLRKAIESEFEKKGLKKVSSNPQVLMAYDVSIQKPAVIPEHNFPEGFGYSYAYQMGYNYDYKHSNISNYKAVNNFKHGTLLIDVIDSRNNELIWRGWAEDVVSDFNATYATVENYVDDIIDKYPPK